MPYTGNLLARAFSRLVKCLLFSSPAFLFLVNSGCPSPEEPLPHSLQGPVITSHQVTAVRSGSDYAEVIRITWQAPPDTQVAVREYQILRNTQTSTDSGFSIAVHSIPPTIQTYNDRIDEIGYPQKDFSVKAIRYRIVAIDEYDRAGDTSATDTVYLANEPSIVYPDTILDSNLFHWRWRGIKAGYTSSMQLWTLDSLYWQSPAVLKYGSELTDEFEAVVPDSLWPLLSGTWFMGVRIKANSADYRQAIAVRKFVVR
ncbi:MAG: hypothetical protein GF398_05380 [Chitinivibrionales bacterium]|nr:hypothetical protein [Chitinivibrionales bacterium]